MEEGIVDGARRLGFPAVLAAVVALSGALMASPARAATFVYVGNTEYPMGKNPNWIEIIDLP